MLLAILTVVLIASGLGLLLYMPNLPNPLDPDTPAPMAFLYGLCGAGTLLIGICVGVIFAGY